MAYSSVEYNQTDPSEDAYEIPFSYISRDHVRVTVDGEEVGFTFLSPSTVSLNVIPSVDSIVRIERRTQRESRLVDFQDGSTLTEAQLDRSALQFFYMIQESLDRSESSIIFGDGAWDGEGYVATGFAPPVDFNDLVTKGWVEAEGSGFLNGCEFFYESSMAVRNELYNLSVNMVSIPSDSIGSASYTTETGTLTLYLPQGGKGPIGDQGPTGDQGIQGPRGSQGIQGPQGIVGPEGPKGDTGLRGPTGLQGPQGPTGDQGPTGPEGPQGPLGPEGPLGQQGPTGSEGPEGPQGPVGDPATGLAFGQLRIDSDGELILEYVGDDLSAAQFTLDAVGDLYVDV